MKQKLVQERPNTGVPFFTNSADGVALLKQYTDAGRITKTESISENQLVKTIELDYASEEDFVAFKLEEVREKERIAREAHCAENSISFSLTNEE